MKLDPEIMEFIRESFNRNFELLKQESSSSISPLVRDVALNQVMIYWHKMNDLANRITDTEVPIHLGNQKSPEGRSFAIEGVVDVLREDDLTLMYDIKTHDPDFVRQNPELYELQLNVYAYVWEQIRGEPLDGIAIIATSYPEEIRDALRTKLLDELTEDEAAVFEQKVADWQPLIEMNYDTNQVEETIRKFGEVVDMIEDGIFAPPAIDVLEENWQKSRERFATRVCRNCDARFSCGAYRGFAIKNQKGNWRLGEFVETFYGDLGTQTEKEDWLTATLNDTPEEDYINALLGEENRS